MKTIYVVMHSCPIQKKGKSKYTCEKYSILPYVERVFSSEDDAIEYVERQEVDRLYYGVYYSKPKLLPGTASEWYYSKYTINETRLHE